MFATFAAKRPLAVLAAFEVSVSKERTDAVVDDRVVVDRSVVVHLPAVWLAGIEEKTVRANLFNAMSSRCQKRMWYLEAVLRGPVDVGETSR